MKFWHWINTETTRFRPNGGKVANVFRLVLTDSAGKVLAVCCEQNDGKTYMVIDQNDPQSAESRLRQIRRMVGGGDVIPEVVEEFGSDGTRRRMIQLK